MFDIFLKNIILCDEIKNKMLNCFLDIYFMNKKYRRKFLFDLIQNE
jgi:hypothetical protein